MAMSCDLLCFVYYSLVFWLRDKTYHLDIHNNLTSESHFQSKMPDHIHLDILRCYPSDHTHLNILGVFSL